uniref:AlNc14C26G2527 protein n=1 Tax=Albugo laibachii Nc14 TaxID=890382 RepID=F0W6N9_9STRA|nr:AlNc14C26G2527 [Albugo laibachii Nc14]|eukprot:CCA16784.1 AlNc14C26G2527 [Albugo laibachii Nc14]
MDYRRKEIKPIPITLSDVEDIVRTNLVTELIQQCHVRESQHIAVFVVHWKRMRPRFLNLVEVGIPERDIRMKALVYLQKLHAGRGIDRSKMKGAGFQKPLSSTYNIAMKKKKNVSRAARQHFISLILWTNHGNSEWTLK